LSAISRTFRPGDLGPVHDYCFARDIPGNTEGQQVFCVVLGVRKGRLTRGQRLHYVLFITPAMSVSRRRSLNCERVGVGYMLGKYIEWDKAGFSVKIH
jgi:hypothetical protein